MILLIISVRLAFAYDHARPSNRMWPPIRHPVMERSQRTNMFGQLNIQRSTNPACSIAYGFLHGPNLYSSLVFSKLKGWNDQLVSRAFTREGDPGRTRCFSHFFLGKMLQPLGMEFLHTINEENACQLSHPCAYVHVHAPAISSFRICLVCVYVCTIKNLADWRFLVCLVWAFGA